VLGELAQPLAADVETPGDQGILVGVEDLDDDGAVVEGLAGAVDRRTLDVEGFDLIDTVDSQVLSRQ
jgi:hypothetical protein